MKRWLAGLVLLGSMLVPAAIAVADHDFYGPGYGYGPGPWDHGYRGQEWYFDGGPSRCLPRPTYRCPPSPCRPYGFDHGYGRQPYCMPRPIVPVCPPAYRPIWPEFGY